MIKHFIYREDLAIVYTYAPNIGTPKYIKQILTDWKREIDSNTRVVGTFKMPLSTMDRWSKKKISKEILDLNYALYQMAQTNIYGAFLPAETEYTFFSCAQRAFSKIDHMLGHKISLNKVFFHLFLLVGG